MEKNAIGTSAQRSKKISKVKGSSDLPKEGKSEPSTGRGCPMSARSWETWDVRSLSELDFPGFGLAAWAAGGTSPRSVRHSATKASANPCPSQTVHGIVAASATGR